MEALHKHKWHFLALGGACAATAALVFLAQRRRGDKRKTDAKSAPKAAPKQHPWKKPSTSTKEIPQKAASSNITRESLPGWVQALGKKQVDELPTLLEWTEKLLDEKAQDRDTLERCLDLIQHFISSGSNKMDCFDEVSDVSLKAKNFDPERALEIMVKLFKDKRCRGYVAQTSVIDHALSTMKEGVKGKSSRACYQKACRLLYFLLPEQSNRRRILSAGGLDVVLQLMEKFSDDPGVLVEGLHVLKVLMAEPSFDLDRAADVAVSCLAEQHRENGELAWQALALIHTLPYNPRAELKVAECAVAAAKHHPRFDAVVEWVAKVLHKFCQEKESPVKAWLRLPEQQNWLETFKVSPSFIKKKSNKDEVGHWVAELYKLCGK